MPLTPEAHHALYADGGGVSLEAQLEAALARNITGGLVVAETVSLARVAATAVAEAPTAEGIGLANLSLEFTATAEIARDANTELFGTVGIRTPELSEFAAAGVDFNRLESELRFLETVEVRPEVVIAPVLSVDTWQTVFQELQDNPRANRDGRIKNGGLLIVDQAVSHWNELLVHDSSVEIDGQRWDVLILPGTGRPEVVEANHSGIDNRGNLSDTLVSIAVEAGGSVDDLGANTIHPTISAYLTLQARRLYTKELPIDQATFTWLHGEFGDPSSLQAPNGSWTIGDGRVRLCVDDVSFRDVNLGIRLPIWGTS